EEAVMRGARVTLITGPTQLLPPLNVTTVKVQTAEEMKEAVLSVFDSAHFVVKAAAVSDFKPAVTLDAKQKKTGRPETITLEPTEDILQLLGNRKTQQVLIGFCAETENLEENARKKLEKKKLDFMVANLVSDIHDPFQSEQNEVLVIDRLGNRTPLLLQKKRQLAFNLWELILERAAEVQTVSTRG
ncbi:MAG TPA: phosphopantothenoylcysteine decarboxylase, partial [Acidobacteriota bacterium]